MKDKVIVIVGPTGSGKTRVAVELAKIIGGEIISADSRTVYKGLDFGTAKPTMEEREGVVHYGFDLVEPNERFTVFDWKKYAEQKICSIRKRGKIPIVVGGTGLYVDALIYNYSFEIDAKENQIDRREIGDEYLVFGIKTDTEELRERLKKRIDKMFTQELYEETNRLVEKYGLNNQAMKSDIYQFAYEYLRGNYSLEEAKEKAFYDDWHLAKRQMTWFKRNVNILWVELDSIVQTMVKYISNE